MDGRFKMDQIDKAWWNLPWPSIGSLAMPSLVPLDDLLGAAFIGIMFSTAYSFPQYFSVCI
jgi:hypothetical protein